MVILLLTTQQRPVGEEGEKEGRTKKSLGEERSRESAAKWEDGCGPGGFNQMLRLGHRQGGLGRLPTLLCRRVQLG